MIKWEINFKCLAHLLALSICELPPSHPLLSFPLSYLRFNDTFCLFVYSSLWPSIASYFPFKYNSCHWVYFTCLRPGVCHLWLMGERNSVQPRVLLQTQIVEYLKLIKQLLGQVGFKSQKVDRLRQLWQCVYTLKFCIYLCRSNINCSVLIGI